MTQCQQVKPQPSVKQAVLLFRLQFHHCTLTEGDSLHDQQDLGGMKQNLLCLPEALL